MIPKDCFHAIMSHAPGDGRTLLDKMYTTFLEDLFRGSVLRFRGSADYFPFPFFSYAHGRYALNGRLRVTCLRFTYLSRAVGPLTRTSPFPSHMFPYLYYYGPSTRLQLCFLFTFTSFGPSTRLCLPFRFMLTLFDSSAESLFLDSDSYHNSLTFYDSLYLYLSV